jgi:phospholipase C
MHIFVLMLENRSFDHMLGFLPRVDHLRDLDGLTGREFNLLDLSDPSSQRFPVRPAAPFEMPEQLDPDHSVPAVNYQLTGSTQSPSPWNRARNDGIVENFAYVAGQELQRDATREEIQLIMDCFDPSHLPVLATLAREFCVCDHWHADVPGPTMPNRIFVHAATSSGVADNQFDRPFPIPTIYEHLQDAGRSWRTYFYDFNDLVQFPRLHLDANNNRFFSAFAGDVASSDVADYTFLQPCYLSSSDPKEVDSSQHAPSDVRFGEELIASVYNAIRSNEELWRDSALIITYDEHGGFYDHVIPPFGIANPDGLTSFNPPFDFRRLGLRVPAVIVSPWIQPQIDTALYSHSSIAATLKEHFDLPQFLTQRDATANRFTHLLSRSGKFREDTPRSLHAAPLPDATDAPARPLSRIQRQMLASLERLRPAAAARVIGHSKTIERQGEAHDFAKAIWADHLASSTTQTGTAARPAGSRQTAGGPRERKDSRMFKALASAISSRLHRVSSRGASKAASRGASAAASRGASRAGASRGASGASSRGASSAASRGASGAASRGASRAAASRGASGAASRGASSAASRGASSAASRGASSAASRGASRTASSAVASRGASRFGSRAASRAAASRAALASAIASRVASRLAASRAASRGASRLASRAASSRPAASRFVSSRAASHASATRISSSTVASLASAIASRLRSRQRARPRRRCLRRGVAHRLTRRVDRRQPRGIRHLLPRCLSRHGRFAAQLLREHRSSCRRTVADRIREGRGRELAELMEWTAPQERHIWLLGSDRVSGTAADEATLEAACRFALEHWQVIGTAGPRLRAWAGDRFAGHPAIRKVSDRELSVRILGELQLLLMDRVARTFALARIPYVFLKGSATRLIAYDRPSDRVGYDIDAAVPGARIRQAEQELLRLGFWQAEFDFAENRFVVADRHLRASVEARHYELGFLARRQRVTNLSPEAEAAIRRDLPAQKPWHATPDGGVACYVSIDLHHGINPEITSEPLVYTSRPVARGMVTLRAPATHWMLYHLIYKIYWEGVHNYGKGGFQYADLCRLLGCVEERDIPPFLRLLQEHVFETGAYFVLRRVPAFGVALPPALEAFVARMAHPPKTLKPVDPLHLNDLGDMWPKLWGGR